MAKLSQKTVKFDDIEENNVQLIVTISSITQFDLPTLTLFKSQSILEGTRIDEHKFSFEIAKQNFTKRIMFRIGFNIVMTDEYLQRLINTCKIKFKFSQDRSQDFSYYPFEGKTVESLKPYHHYSSYQDIN